MPQATQRSLSCFFAAVRIGDQLRGGLRVRGRGEAADPGEGVEVGQPEVERLAAAHRQAGEGPVLAVGLDRVARLDRGDHVLQQVLLERREGRRGGEDVPLGPVVLLARPLGMTTIIGAAFPSAIRLSRRRFGWAKRCHSVSSPPMPCSRYSTGYFFSVGVARRRVDLHLAGRADRLRVVGDHLQLPVRHVLLGVDPGRADRGTRGRRRRSGRSAAAAAGPGRPAEPRGPAAANRSGANSFRQRRQVSHSCDVPGDS